MNNDEKTITKVLNNAVNPLHLWYDWFCRSSSLPAKSKKLLTKLRVISGSAKFNNDECYVFFENRCPLIGSLFDEFKICDVKTSKVLYAVIPSSGFKATKGKAIVWGRENNFEKPIITGTWTEVKRWFLTS